MGKDLDKDLKNLHVKIGEQNIDSDSFDDILLKGKLKYPSIKFKIEGKVSVHSFNALKNCFSFKEGSHYFVLEAGGALRSIGKMDLNIDNIYRLESLFKRLNPEISVIENEGDDFKVISSKDLVDTIELKVKGVSEDGDS